MDSLYSVKYLNKFNYLQVFTCIIKKNKSDRLLVDINGANHLRVIEKKDIINLKLLIKKNYGNNGKRFGTNHL